MKKQTTSVFISDPCKQEWDGMTPAAGGRHCAMCSKTVTDFTLMSDGQILDFFKQAKGRHVCGNFLAAQLERPLTDNRYRPLFYSALLKKAAAVIILFQSFSLSALAQQAKKNSAATTQQPLKKAPAKNTQRQIFGRVLDEATRTPMAGITIRIKETGVTATTDTTGMFKLELPLELAAKNITLEQVAIPNDVTVPPYFMNAAAILFVKEVVLHGHKKATRQLAEKDIRVMGGSQVTDLVALTPGIYRQVRGGAGISQDGGRSTGNLYVIDGVPVDTTTNNVHNTFWRRITNPFRRKVNKQ